ncbi:MAG: hypothetical protein LBD82_00780, partial [Deltaproteobacteria bacterium]|nr:hypothetical protein [Deltaproteobacteria bacterium]
MAHDVRISVPAAGRHVVDLLSTGGQIIFDFSINDTNMDLSRNGVDLEISFENGSSLILRDFFAFSDLSIVAGDVELSGQAFLSNLAPELITASEEILSGGMNNYDDRAGSLIGGIESLDAETAFILQNGGRSLDDDGPQLTAMPSVPGNNEPPPV